MAGWPFYGRIDKVVCDVGTNAHRNHLLSHLRESRAVLGLQFPAEHISFTEVGKPRSSRAIYTSASAHTVGTGSALIGVTILAKAAATQLATPFNSGGKTVRMAG